MKKELLITILTISSITYCTAQKFDTLYYDKDWKGAKNALFASYYRIYDASDKSTDGKPFRDYFISGQLQAEGRYITIDKYDDSKSVFDGEMTSYYKNGQIEYKRFENRGVKDGEFLGYYENGRLKIHAFFRNNELDGVVTKIDEKGNISQEEYANGKPKYNYYYYGTANGLFGKVNRNSGKVIWESPDPKEKKTAYKNGAEFPYYIKNGVKIAMGNTITDYYNDWYQITIIITNNSLEPIDFDPEKITAVITSTKGEETPRHVWTADEFHRKVARAQKFAAITMEIASGLNAVNDGMSVSQTNSYSQSSGYSTSTTVTYNAFEAQLQRTMRQNQLMDWENAMAQERIARSEDYLRRTTINPGEAIYGYVNIEQYKARKEKGILVTVDINGAKYPFYWNN